MYMYMYMLEKCLGYIRTKFLFVLAQVEKELFYTVGKFHNQTKLYSHWGPEKAIGPRARLRL